MLPDRPLPTLTDPSDLRRYFSQIPNLIVDDVRVCPMGLALYVYYRRVAGEKGRAFKAQATIERELGVGHSKFLACRTALAEMGYLVVTARPSQTTVVEITDVWDQNMRQYAQEPTVRQADTTVRHTDGDHPPGGRKEEPSEEEPLKEEPLKKGSERAHTRKTVLDADYQDQLIEEFAERLGSRDRVEEEIAAAQGHKSWERWNDKQRYVRNWLTRAAGGPSPGGSAARSRRVQEYGHLLGGSAQAAPDG